MEDILLVLVVTGMLGLVCAMASSRLPRGTGPLAFLFVFSSFSGFLNNLTNRNPVVQVARYGVLAVVCLSWMMGRRKVRLSPTPLDRTMKFLLVVYCIQILNPSWSSMEVGLLNGVIGILQHALPMSLFFIAREAMHQPVSIQRVFQLLAGLSTVMAIYGIYQWWVGVDHLRSLGAGFAETLDRERVWIAGRESEQIFRPMSFASDAGTASAYYAIGILIAGALLVEKRARASYRALLLVSMVLLFTSLSFTLVRSTMVAAVVGLASIFYTEPRLRRWILPISVLGTLLVTSTTYDAAAIRDRYSTLLNSDSVIASRGRQLEAIYWVATTFPLGMGIGRVGPGAHKFSPPEDRMYSVPPESYFVCLGFEAGVLGLGAAFLLFFRLGLYVSRGLRVIRDPELRHLALATSVVLLPTMLISFVGPTLYTVPLSYCFWFFAGVLFRLFEMEHQARRRNELAAGARLERVGP